ncbi:unnamed protein product, partial [Pelagomonas calceolata]
ASRHSREQAGLIHRRQGPPGTRRSLLDTSSTYVLHRCASTRHRARRAGRQEGNGRRYLRRQAVQQGQHGRVRHRDRRRRRGRHLLRRVLPEQEARLHQVNSGAS